jgi:hypothetical protein
MEKESASNEDTLKWLRKGIEDLLDARVKHQTEEVNATLTGIVQCYLLLQILDKLECIDDSIIAMATDNDGIIRAIRDNTMRRI